MVILFGLEFIEGISCDCGVWRDWPFTPELAHARAEQLASFTHFLDIPILLVIVSLGALRRCSSAR
jgi:hypothetical protein